MKARAGLGPALAAVVILLLTGCGGDATRSAPASPSPGAASTAPQAERTVRPGTTTVARPVRISVPALEIESRLQPLGLDDQGRLQSPARWQRAGWYADGPRPGGQGPAVVAGHVDSPTGPAVFAALPEIRSGDLIVIERRDGGSTRFVVDRTDVVPQDSSFPTEAVYGPTPDAQLRLITCDGPFVESQGGYQMNFVAYATAVAS